MPKPTNAEMVKKASELARSAGLYIITRQETRKGQPVLMYLVFRRLRFANHGTLVGKRNSPAGLLKLVTAIAEVV